MAKPPVTGGGRLPELPAAQATPLPPAAVLASGVRISHGVPYDGVPGGRPLELDLYLPPDPADVVPVVVFFHGGGWRLGSRRSAGPMFAGADPSPFEVVALAGIAVISVDYRLSGEAIWPAQLHDIRASVRWLRSRATELGIDATRIATWGESAGGHLALMLGLLGSGGPADAPGAASGSDVAAVAAWYPPTDLLGLPADLGTAPSDTTTREALLLGSPAEDRPDIAAGASPIAHVSADNPPVLLLHGEADQLVPFAQSTRLAEAITAAGAAGGIEGQVELHTYPGADHMWRGAPDVAADALDRTVSYLRARLSVA